MRSIAMAASLASAGPTPRVWARAAVLPRPPDQLSFHLSHGGRMSDSTLAVTLERRIARVALDRPDVHNAFDDRLIAELTATLLKLEADPGVRAVVLTGNGASFSAGADLNWMRRMAQAGEQENRADSERLAALMRTLNFLAKPTVARVTGAAYGGGVGLVACCDFALAADTAKFGLTEVKLGLVPAVISPYVVAAIGGRHA